MCNFHWCYTLLTGVTLEPHNSQPITIAESLYYAHGQDSLISQCLSSPSRIKGCKGFVKRFKAFAKGRGKPGRSNMPFRRGVTL